MLKTYFKRISSSILLIVALLTGSSLAQAQTGEKSFGLMGGFSTYNNGGYTSVFFQYTCAPHVRLAPEVGYAFRNDGASAFLLSMDVDIPFKVARGVNVYPLVGVTFNNWNYQGGGDCSRLGFDFGGGVDLNVTSQLKLLFQAKYSVMNDTSGGFIGMGIGYNF